MHALKEKLIIREGITMFKAAIVEDSESDKKLLESYLKKLGGFIVSSFSSAVDFLTGYRPTYDLVFMDIDMPYLDGMSAARKLRELDENVCLVFVTNFARFAVHGYEVTAYDFIVKPILYEDFTDKMPRIIKKLESQTSGRMLLIHAGTDSIRIAVDEILYVEVMGHKLVYHMLRKNIVSYGTLKKVEEELTDPAFVRCNKCYLVNLRHVTGIEGNHAIVGGDKLLISYPRRANFTKALADYLCG